MQIFIAGLATETNTFAPTPTGRAAFEEYGVTRHTSTSGGNPFQSVLRAWRAAADTVGDELFESYGAFAQPAGRTLRSTYESLRDAILDDLRGISTADVVLLFLHGAMVADGYDDCEGDLIGRVRAIAPHAVIGVELDLHCHLTAKMVANADFVVPCKLYPHTDLAARAAELSSLCGRAARREITPVAALVDTRMIGIYPTFASPMREIVGALEESERRAGVLTAGVGHGFPWGDVADVGTRVLVYADGDGALAAREAAAIADRLYEAREPLRLGLPDLQTSLERARALNGRIVLGDFADNAGGGAPGDSTYFLRALLDGGWRKTVIGFFWDPMVVACCAEAGAGARLAVRLGGKTGPASGPPIDLEVEVVRVAERHDQGVFGARQPMGRSVWLHSGGIDIGVCTVRTQVYEPDAFTGLGLTLHDKRLIVVKSSNHYQAGFQSLADHLWHVGTPGAMSTDFASLPYTKRDPDYFPRVSDPWARRGRPIPEIFPSRPRR